MNEGPNQPPSRDRTREAAWARLEALEYAVAALCRRNGVAEEAIRDFERAVESGSRYAIMGAVLALVAALPAPSKTAADRGKASADGRDRDKGPGE